VALKVGFWHDIIGGAGNCDDGSFGSRAQFLEGFSELMLLYGFDQLIVEMERNALRR
jgi:hypothetical protein